MNGPSPRNPWTRESNSKRTCGCGHGPFEGAHSAALEFAAARDFLGYTHLQRPSVADAKPQGLKYLTRRDAIGLPRLSRTILPM